MKYSNEVIINAPRDKVIELFDNFDNMSKWQKGFQSYSAISGTPGQVGAKSHLVYEMNGRKIEMVETITERNLPDVFSGTYDVEGVHNIIENRFIEEGGKTRWIANNEFQFKGIMKLMSIFMRGTIKKQTLSDMNRFKEFAESA